MRPGGGEHGGWQYYKSTYKDETEVRVVDPNSTYKPFSIAPYQRYLDTQGNRITYEGGRWTPWR